MNQPQSIQPACWVFFDKIYCISLENRPDRRAQAGKQFSDVGLLTKIEFVVVKKHPENQEKGIFQSHMHCLRKGLAAGAQNILIFEDDVFFQGLNYATLQEVCTHLDTAGNWNGLFLGCITDGSEKTDNKNLVKITYRCLAHAYALNRPFAESIVKKEWLGIPFDELLRRHKSNFYALYPMCAFQGLAGSDNQTVVINRVRKIFGGLPFIQKMNELYQNHKKSLLSSSLVILLVAAVIVFRLW